MAEAGGRGGGAGRARWLVRKRDEDDGRGGVARDEDVYGGSDGVEGVGVGGVGHGEGVPPFHCRLEEALPLPAESHRVAVVAATAEPGGGAASHCQPALEISRKGRTEGFREKVYFRAKCVCENGGESGVSQKVKGTLKM